MSRLKFRILIFTLLAFSGALTTLAQSQYNKLAEKLLKTGLQNQYTYVILKKITSTGARLAGSKGAADAVYLTQQIMSDLGFDNVHLEAAEVPHWVRGKPAQARLISESNGSLPLAAAAIGGSIATPDSGITAQVLEVKSFEELSQLGEEGRGKIIFFNRPMDPTQLNTFLAYRDAASQRTSGAVEAAKIGALAALVRSLTSRLDDFPHTGMMRYDPDVPQIPAACLSTKAAENLSQVLKQDPQAKVYLHMSCQHLDPVLSHNVVGQITGAEKSNEIILLGGHLDCWDLSHGAHDDGAGCAQSIAALRLLKILGVYPKRTIRAVMFMNEEFGGSGGRDYASAPERQGEKHLVALESDRGGFLPLALGIGGSSAFFSSFKTWEPLFQAVGLQKLQPGGGGVDIGPLAQHGTILCSLIPDSQRYFDVHHSGKDVIESVHPRELELGTIAMALFAYILAQEGI